MIVREWREGDVERMKVQHSQLSIKESLLDLDIAPLAEQGLVWTGESDEGIIAVGGLAPQWKGRAVAWTVISEISGKYFMQIHRAVRDVLIHSGFRRIEATVDVNFKQGHRWMKMLGFEPEGYMKAYTPSGDDQILYARVRM